MPIYEYRREDGTTFEVMQSITEDALTVCPTTGQKVTKHRTGHASFDQRAVGSSHVTARPDADDSRAMFACRRGDGAVTGRGPFLH